MVLYQLNMSNGYIIGIDGGGTKTLGVLWDNNNREIKRTVKGFANFNVDPIKTKNNIRDVIEDLIGEAGKKPLIVMGLSGLTGLLDVKSYEQELENQYNANVIVENDGFLALNSVDNFKNLPIILTISGTGSIVYSLKEGVHYRFGGHGHILGDEGSSYDVAIRAFKKIVHELDLDKLSEFSTEFLKLTNFKNQNDIKYIVYHMAKNEVAKYSQIVDQLSTENNDAREILEKSAISLSKQIISLSDRLQISDNYILALRGGLLDNSKFFRDTLLSELVNNNHKFIVDKSNNEPVYGALNVKREK